jgi:hypothetical protein
MFYDVLALGYSSHRNFNLSSLSLSRDDFSAEMSQICIFIREVDRYSEA